MIILAINLKSSKIVSITHFPFKSYKQGNNFNRHIPVQHLYCSIILYFIILYIYNNVMDIKL